MEPLDTPLIGRDRELALLSAFVTAPEGRALVLRGEAGVGKSALVDHAARLAARADQAVIRVTGVEAESDLPFAGLHQCLHPLLSRAAELAPRQRAVLDVVFGRGSGEPPSVLSLGIAALDLLSPAGSERPLTLLIDDGQWLDDASAEVCGFVARRLAAGSVKMLIALRAEVRSAFDHARLAELPVEALSEEAAGRLLALRHPRLDERARRTVLDHARGNPLALQELPPYLAAPHPATDLFAAPGVPLPRRLQQLYGERIEHLDPAVRMELLRGALDGAAAGRLTGRTHGTRYRMREAEPAATSGLLDIDAITGDFVFRHPLVRSAVIQLATPDQRRSAHADLARVHRADVERHAGHLAASAVDPDESVAAVLETAAGSATRRGGAAAAVAWLTRAAELSERPADRSRRLGDAAYLASQAALLDEAQRLLHRSALEPGTAATLATVLASAHADFVQAGAVRQAFQRLAAAIERCSDDEAESGGETLTRAVDALVTMAHYAGDPALWQRAERILDSLGDRVHPLTALYRDASAVARGGAGLRTRLERAFADQAYFAPWDLARLGVCASHLDVLSQYRTELRRAVERESEAGAVSSVMILLRMLMLDQMYSGDWAEAERTGRQALELSTAHGHVLLAYHTRAVLGQLVARQGRLDAARELQAAVDTWARPRGVGLLTQITEAIATGVALTEGDFEAAYLYAIGMTSPGSFDRHAHQIAPRALLELVEAALYSGRRDQARRHALAACEAGLPEASPRLALSAYGALAMTADDLPEAAELYARVEAHAAAFDFPFELARIRLAYGFRLRELKAPRAARQTPLLLAAEAFDRLGCTAWADRARAELRGAGRSPGPPAPGLAGLTWQERRVAELAARGLTNKEIGERTRLSPRTVSSHLYRVFPKLGITSRAALRDALSEAPARDAPS
ncbi:regulatory LuxR family protein [Streptomyces sp. PanSC19]|uniref:AAA family ATPase n=1 Tax=Streptomyces sp. PanSC19 TaxID=1520455 RepID=UPI000F4ACDAF|nr:LuxR family transcriptional regulator [Streptomyces sp. PanSC19]ROQ26496.1 regulatory LuxR family protein [Streptomyces sp. PanSC19]